MLQVGGAKIFKSCIVFWWFKFNSFENKDRWTRSTTFSLYVDDPFQLPAFYGTDFDFGYIRINSPKLFNSDWSTEFLFMIIV